MEPVVGIRKAALHALLSLEISAGRDVSICCVGTDGIDGNSMAAGALVTGTMVSHDSPSTKEELRRYLKNHDSSARLHEIGFPDNYRKDVDQCE